MHGHHTSEVIAIRVIAHVRNGRTATDDADWGRVESRIEMEPDLAAGLVGLEQFSHALVVFYMHLDPDREPATLQRRPRGRSDMPLLGVFAQRGRMRPNPIGVSTVEIVRVEPKALVVRGLDAVDGTPVLDLKPYAPVFDRRDEARSPEWLDRLMQGYF
jgi:tRNA-Thr(GGU) m(6)t(6)A37 methyltransferase TsaA